MATRTVAFGVSAVMAVGLLLGQALPLEAQEPAQWEALGPEQQPITRLFTPTSGALLASGDDSLKGAFIRSDDAGGTWRTIERPDGTDAMAVSPANHQLLHATGPDRVLRSQDGGGTWEQTSDHAGSFSKLEISAADPDVLYAVAITSPPTTNGTNRWHEFYVSRDAGASWENVRTHHETILGGTQPCSYSVRLLMPHPVSTTRVVTIEGCTGRGMDPVPGASMDEGRTVEPSPQGDSKGWPAISVIGGGGVSPGRWYASLYLPGISYTRLRHSRVLRSDDDGQTWTMVYEDDGGQPDRNMAKPMDFASRLAYDPQRPDDLYAVFEHYEPAARAFEQHKLTGSRIRVSHDGGTTWADLGMPDGEAVNAMAVGIDSRYLFVGTANGVYRLALQQ